MPSYAYIKTKIKFTKLGISLQILRRKFSNFVNLWWVQQAGFSKNNCGDHTILIKK